MNVDSNLVFEPLPLILTGAGLKPKDKMVLQRLWLMQRLSERPITLKELTAVLDMKEHIVRDALLELQSSIPYMISKPSWYPNAKNINWQVIRAGDGYAVKVDFQKAKHKSYNKSKWPKIIGEYGAMAAGANPKDFKAYVKEVPQKAQPKESALSSAFKSLAEK